MLPFSVKRRWESSARHSCCPAAPALWGTCQRGGRHPTQPHPTRDCQSFGAPAHPAIVRLHRRRPRSEPDRHPRCAAHVCGARCGHGSNCPIAGFSIDAGTPTSWPPVRRGPARPARPRLARQLWSPDWSGRPRILMAVPFSITGGVLALLVFGDSINMYSNIGLVTLIGLVTKNSIMLVEFTNQLREEGKKITEAVIESAKLRLRPILMTSIATICGALPLVFSSGAGASSRNSIGLVIVGGMLVGTIFTIFVIPVLYQTFKREGTYQR